MNVSRDNRENFGIEIPTTSRHLNRPRRELPLLFSRNYFQIVDQNISTKHQRTAVGVSARCMYCADQKKLVRGTLKVTSNFVHHLRQHHPLIYEKYRDEKRIHYKGGKSLGALNMSIAEKELIDPAPIINVKVENELLTVTNGDNEAGVTNQDNGIDFSSYLHKTEEPYSLTEQGQMQLGTPIGQKVFGSMPKAPYIEAMVVIPPSTAKTQINAEVTDSGNNSNTDGTVSYMDAGNEMENETIDSEEIPIIVNGKYFKIIDQINTMDHQREAGSIVAVCQLCPLEKQQVLQDSIRTTLHFERHIKTVHPTEYEEYLVERELSAQALREKRGQKRKSSQVDEQHGHNSTVEGYFDDVTDVIEVKQSNIADNTDIYSVDSNDSHLSDYSMDKKAPCVLSQQIYDPNDIPTILNGKYFQIIEQDTQSNRASISVVAACQFCNTDKFVKGPLKVTSNFVQHLRSKHLKEYNMYVQEKSTGNTKCRRTLSKQEVQQPFIEKVLNFILSSCVSMSVVEDPSFMELFSDRGVLMFTRTQLLSRLDDKHTYFVDYIKHDLQAAAYICASADIWSSRNKHYFAYSCYWLDDDLKAHMAALACVRLSDEPTYYEIDTLIKKVYKKYDFNEDKIIYTVIDGINDFVQTHHNFSVNSICTSPNNKQVEACENFTLVCSSAQNLLNQLPKTYKRGSHSLHLLAVFDFSSTLESYEALQDALKRCINILYKCNQFQVNETGGCLLDCPLKAPVDVRWPAWYSAVTQLLKHKNKLDELCASLGVPNFTPTEIEYLEDLTMLLKPIADALDFLQQTAYLHFGYFLPSLVTIKVKLKKLHECGRIKHLHAATQEMINALLKRFREYFEMTAECNDAIIAAIVCPAVKMRFVEALQETAPNVTTDGLISLFVEYALEFYVDNESMSSARESRKSSVDSFLCFSPDDNEELPPENKTIISIRKELTNYLYDEDKTIACLNRYPLVKKVFHKYNTLPPTSVTLEKFFQSFLNVIHGQIGQNLSDELLERFLLTKMNTVLLK